MSDILIVEVNNSTLIKTFVRLPFFIYKNNPNWVPYIISEEIKLIGRNSNPSYKFCDAAFWIAFKDGKCVGRIGAIINNLYNEKMGEPIGRFTRAEFIDDKNVSKYLFETAENWLKNKGMTKILGPLGFNNLDNQGLLVEGFEHIASVGSVYHMPYYKDHVEALEYEKEIDWVEFRLKIADIPEKALRLNDIIKKRLGVKALNFTSKKEMQPYTSHIFDLLNEAYDDLPFVSPFPPDLVDFYSKKYTKLLVPRFVKVVVNQDNRIVAFVVSLPTISRALQKSKGKIFPFGFIYIMRALKKPTGFELLLSGINPKMQGQGIPALLINELQKEILKSEGRWVETTGNFETNNKVIEHWKNYEHIQHKRKRCYKKHI